MSNTIAPTLLIQAQRWYSFNACPNRYLNSSGNLIVETRQDCFCNQLGINTSRLSFLYPRANQPTQAKNRHREKISQKEHRSRAPSKKHIVPIHHLTPNKNHHTLFIIPTHLPSRIRRPLPKTGMISYTNEENNENNERELLFSPDVNSDAQSRSHYL